jgi:8-oxo-dGTP pyrophosphatase MutT (NUDIX family)
MKQRFKITPAVYLVLRNLETGKVLLSRRFNTGYADGSYSMVAGHLDGDEPLTVALAREAQEEAGINIEPSDLKLVHIMHLRSEVKDSIYDEYVTFYFETNKFEGTPSVMEPNKCDAMEWFDPEHLPSPMIEHVELALANIRNGISFSEFGWK